MEAHKSDENCASKSSVRMCLLKCVSFALMGSTSQKFFSTDEFLQEMKIVLFPKVVTRYC